MKALAAIGMCVITGCAANPDRYRNTSTMQLCTEYMTLPSLNIWHPSRAAELQRRGENCGGYAGIAAGQQQADQRTLETLQSMQPPPPRQPIRCQSDRFGNTTCW